MLVFAVEWIHGRRSVVMLDVAGNVFLRVEPAIGLDLCFDTFALGSSSILAVVLHSNVLRALGLLVFGGFVLWFDLGGWGGWIGLGLCV